MRAVRTGALTDLGIPSVAAEDVARLVRLTDHRTAHLTTPAGCCATSTCRSSADLPRSSTHTMHAIRAEYAGCRTTLIVRPASRAGRDCSRVITCLVRSSSVAGTSSPPAPIFGGRWHAWCRNRRDADHFRASGNSLTFGDRLGLGRSDDGRPDIHQWWRPCGAADEEATMKRVIDIAVGRSGRIHAGRLQCPEERYDDRGHGFGDRFDERHAERDGHHGHRRCADWRRDR